MHHCDFSRRQPINAWESRKFKRRRKYGGCVGCGDRWGFDRCSFCSNKFCSRCDERHLPNEPNIWCQPCGDRSCCHTERCPTCGVFCCKRCEQKCICGFTACAQCTKEHESQHIEKCGECKTKDICDTVLSLKCEHCAVLSCRKCKKKCLCGVTACPRCMEKHQNQHVKVCEDCKRVAICDVSLVMKCTHCGGLLCYDRKCRTTCVCGVTGCQRCMKTHRSRHIDRCGDCNTDVCDTMHNERCERCERLTCKKCEKKCLCGIRKCRRCMIRQCINCVMAKDTSSACPFETCPCYFCEISVCQGATIRSGYLTNNGSRKRVWACVTHHDVLWCGECPYDQYPTCKKHMKHTLRYRSGYPRPFSCLDCPHCVKVVDLDLECGLVECPDEIRRLIKEFVGGLTFCGVCGSNQADGYRICECGRTVGMNCCSLKYFLNDRG